MPYRRLTDAEKEYLCKAWTSGVPASEIAQKMGRTIIAVQRWAARYKVRRASENRAEWHPVNPGRKPLALIVRYDDGRVRRFPTLRVACQVLGVDLSNHRRHPGGYYPMHGFRVLPDTPENAAHGKEYREHPGLDCMDWPRCLRDMPGAHYREQFRWNR